jgi:hypothetical protein
MKKRQCNNKEKQRKRRRCKWEKNRRKKKRENGEMKGRSLALAITPQVSYISL